ncbi:hypothetical protein pb186bvf_008476 [Paramecium bursaria]
MGSGPSHPQQRQAVVMRYNSQPNLRQPVVQQPLARANTLLQQSSQPIVMTNDVILKDFIVENKFLQFQIKNNVPFQFEIYAFGKEVFVATTNQTLRIEQFRQREVQQIQAQSQSNFKCTIIQLDLEKLSKDELTHKDNYWPLVICSTYPVEQKMYYFMEFEHMKPKLKKQKLIHPKGTFEINEIYGIDNSVVMRGGLQQAAEECTICISESIDTIIMPCRHMCICNECAKKIQEKLKQFQIDQQQHPQQNRAVIQNPNHCPVCRTEIETFIRLKKVQ